MISSLHLPILGSTKLSTICPTCQMGKSCCLPFGLSESSSTFPLEMIHSDIWGPSPIASISGRRYYVIFIDNFSRYVWFSLITNKSEMFDIFVAFKNLLKILLDEKLRCCNPMVVVSQ